MRFFIAERPITCKLGLGYSASHDAWDFFLKWTRFNTEYSKNVSAPVGGFLNQTISSQTSSFAVGLLSSASDHFDLRLDVGDFEIGREFFISKCLSLRPHIGARGVAVREKSDVFYSWVAGQSVQTPDYITFKNDFWGIGGRAGLDTQWKLGEGFSFLGNAAASFLVGKYYELSVTETAGAPLAVIHHVSDPYDVSKFVFDIFLGLSWDHSFSNDKYFLGLQAGWESLFFSNQWQWQSATFSPTPNGDLSLSGLSFGARFDF
ncbi:MAG: hypothetical protein HZB76_04015 [Chlamydiae bacterium]|nr:hypothetical protein [Chlamydiota bacterium]